MNSLQKKEKKIKEGGKATHDLASDTGLLEDPVARRVVNARR